jgi:hypothetical protein
MYKPIIHQLISYIKRADVIHQKKIP